MGRFIVDWSQTSFCTSFILKKPHFWAFVSPLRYTPQTSTLIYCSLVHSLVIISHMVVFRCSAINELLLCEIDVEITDEKVVFGFI